jgi:hypothetical protein
MERRKGSPTRAGGGQKKSNEEKKRRTGRKIKATGSSQRKTTG